MSLQFQDFRVYDFNPPLTVEDAYRKFFNFGELHENVFEQAYALASDNWYASGNSSPITSFTVDPDSVFIDATGSSGAWHKVIHTIDSLPHSLLLKYHKTQQRQGAILGTQVDGSHYLVATDNSGNVTISKGTGAGVYTTVFAIQKGTPVEADVEIALRHIRFSDNDADLWRTITLWMNDALVCTWAEKVANLLVPPINFGFAVYATDTVTYTDVVIPQLTEFAETCTLDPAESPSGGLGRATEGRYLKQHMRWDGSVRAWRPKEVGSAHSFVTSDSMSLELPFDRRAIFNHIRQVGAYRQAEYVREDLVQTQGHRFDELNNPFLMSEDECYTQARLSILRMESEANQIVTVSPLTPLVEMEDRITTPQGDYVVSSREVSIEQSKIYQRITARLYNVVGA